VDIDGKPISTGLVTFLDSISPIAESYRRLQSNVAYSKPDEPYKCLLVTSSNKSEGKSTLTANLAITLAESGNRVVVVDCDFRRPRVHKIFGVAKTPGVVEQLFSNKPIGDFVQETVIPNLFVVTAGNKPPNPAEINRSKKLKAAIEELKATFDYVLLDTPPYGIITDAAPLIKLVDGVVLVAKLNQTISAELDHTIDNLKRINANVIGSVMNAYDKRKTSGYYYSDYYYQYSYDSYSAYEKQNS
jgi:capsular exopolysaccharide synthesis family protein